ncbi:MAG: tetratricopeptide repeat protein [Candidatus Glassbacteria bacterium]|nr:tetratricopeptide repeat protein [Candidatus Glassbacteria bacterium]
MLLALIIQARPAYTQETWYATYDMALEAISQGRWEEAVTRLEAALSQKPAPELNARTYGVWRRNYLPFYHLGVAYYNMGNYELAREYFSRSLDAGVIKNSPENLEALESYLKAIAEQVSSTQAEMTARIQEEFAKGLELEREGKLEQAQVKFESVLTLDPGSQTASEHLERINMELESRRDQARITARTEEALNKGKAHLEAGNLQEALKSFDEVLSLSPDQPEALSLREQAESQLNRLALEESNKKTKLRKLMPRGDSLLKQGRLQEALEVFEEVLSIVPQDKAAAGYIDRINRLQNELTRRELQAGLLLEAEELLAKDSLIASRDKVIMAKELGASLIADSMLSLLDSLFAERERITRFRDLPQLVLNIPPDSGYRLSRPQALLAGTASDDDGITRIAVVVNGVIYEIYQLQENQPLNQRISFEKKVRLDRGANLIVLEVYDTKATMHKTSRTVFYQPPFWRSPLFLTACLLLLILAGGSYYYYKRSLIQYLLNRFRRRPFEVIDPNPFIVGNPIRSREMFFGREDDFSFVKSKVDNEQYGSLIVLFGERRAGKTSLLYQILGGKLGPDYQPVFIDMQAMAVNNDSEYLGRMAEITVETVGRDKLDYDLTQFENKSRNPYTLFDKFIDKLLGAIGNVKILFLFDEYELIEDKVEDKKLNKDIFLFLSGLVEHKPGLFLIFTGTHLLQERKKAYWHPLLHRCDYRNISYLTANDTRRLITEPVKDKVFYLGSSVSDVMRLTAGQPFYTQLVCRNVVEMLNEQQRNYFYEEDIPAIVREIIDNPPPQMIYFWAGLSSEEKVTLSVTADLCKHRDTYSSLKDINESIAKNSLPSTPEQVKKACETMVGREVLEVNTRQVYRFRMDLLRIWIREDHNLYKVSREITQPLSV